jgi:HlyD family secretion protein
MILPQDNANGTKLATARPVMTTQAAAPEFAPPPATRPGLSSTLGSSGSRRIAYIVVAVLIVALLAWWMVHRQAGGAMSYRLATVERGNVQQTVTATGTLSAVKTVQVGTQVSGQVSAEFADFNDHVSKGQLLAQIDPTLQQQAVRDAQAQLEKAQAQLRQTQQEYNRNAPLAKEKFISASEFGTVQVNLSVAQATVKSAQVTLDRAKQNLSYTNIYAPINGVVVERNVDVGQTVAASLSAPQLYLIAQDLAQMQILAAVDESDISAIKAGQAVQFTVQAYPGRNFAGSVDEVRLQSKLQDNVVSYTAVVRLDNSDGKLLPGMTATVEFITGSANNVLTVPNAALRFKPSAEELAAAGLPPTAGQDTTRRARGGSAAGSGGAATGAGAGGTAAGAGAGAAPTGAAAGQRAATGGAGGAAAGAAGAAGATRPRRAGSGTGVGGPGTIWTLDASKKLKPLRVRIGLSDGQRTQVTSDSLTAGMQVIVGETTAGSAAPAAATSNPLTPQRGGGGGRPPGGL